MEKRCISCMEEFEEGIAVCPHCGRETEVYSRITGYYRPLRNWNDGKAQEYRERREYCVEEALKAPEAAEPEEALLFSTVTCPNCRMAEEILKRSGIQYQKIVVKDEESAAIARKYQVQSVPVFISGKKRYTGITEITALS